ncbi:MAG: hypothetical protein Kow0042_08040 [Calditrichia bacterium]
MGVKIVITAHNAIPHDSGDRYIRIYSKLYITADRVITLSEYVKKQVLKLSPQVQDKIIVISHGDVSFVFNQVKHLSGIEYDKPVIAFSGSISPYKDLFFLLDVFKIVLKKVDAYLLIQGYANEPVDKYMDYAKKIETFDNILWHIGYLQIQEMYPLLKNVKLFVFPYKQATQSGAVIMAFTLGKPVVIRPRGGLPEMIIDGKDGFIAETKEKMAEKIIDLLTNENKYLEMVSFIQTSRKKLNDWNYLCDKTRDLYQELMK